MKLRGNLVEVSVPGTCPCLYCIDIKDEAQRSYQPGMSIVNGHWRQPLTRRP